MFIQTLQGTAVIKEKIVESVAVATKMTPCPGPEKQLDSSGSASEFFNL
jgi:hypothetical protein